jgi:hypothetical protein
MKIGLIFKDLDVTPKDNDDLSPEEIARRRDNAIRRALSTPPKPTRELIGKTERAKAQRKTRELRARQSKPKGDEAS